MEAKHTPIIDRDHPNHGSGTQRVYRFDNGFGASVIQSRFSYGGDEGLWELAVLKFDDPETTSYSLTYETPITNDVIGHLSEAEVDDLLDRIAALSRAGAAA